MKHFILSIIISLSLFTHASAELNDQGLNSIISIIDKAIETMAADEAGAEQKTEEDISSNTIIGMARTLGKLSFSRLQCGEADVLSEFTQRVQAVPDAYKNAMRTAFQEGFDKSKASSKLLSPDECERLTESRQLKATEPDSKVDAPKEKSSKQQAKQPTEAEDPKLKHLRLAHMTGQFAFKKKYCGDKKIITKDFNDIILQMPKELQDEGKKAYWKGYNQGKRMNTNLTKDQC